MSTLKGFLLDFCEELIVAKTAAECYDNGYYFLIVLFFVKQLDRSLLSRTPIRKYVVLEEAWRVVSKLILLLWVAIRAYWILLWRRKIICIT